jgi:hypothetical protein
LLLIELIILTVGHWMTDSLNPVEQIKRLLGNFSHMDARMKHIDLEESAPGTKIKVRCSYLPIQDGEQTVREYTNTLSNHVIPFTLPRSVIQSTYEQMSSCDHVKQGLLMNDLSEKSRRLFIKAKKGSHRSGEGGEIALYILNEWQLKAPQIISKMYLKTNNNMPVHGNDGIHARYDARTDQLTMYWGESKAHKTLGSALTDALTSIKKFIDEGQQQREIEIIKDFADFYGLDQTAIDGFLAYFDPYDNKFNSRKTKFSCLLIFEPNQVPNVDKLSDEEIEAEHIAIIKKKADTFVKNISKNVANAGLATQSFEIFLLPVPSVQKFRDDFQSKIGWPSA